MRIPPQQLSDSLKRGLAPVYLVAGDEPLLVDETCMAIRGAARDAGYTEREVYHTDRSFDWSQLQGAGSSMSLFGDKRLVEVRLPTGKPGEGAKALTAWAEAPPEDALLLVISARLDSSTQRSKWVTALEEAGHYVAIYALDADSLPGWIAARMRKHGLQPGAGVVETLAWHFEGNLLACSQEIEKLAMLTQGEITLPQVEGGLSDNARFDVYGLVDTALSGDSRAALRQLHRLRGEGVAQTLILWALAREVRSLYSIAQAVASGVADSQAFRTAGVWSRRQGLVRQALRRQPGRGWAVLLQRAARVDRVIKGRAAGDSWQELQELVLGMSGHPLRLATGI